MKFQFYPKKKKKIERKNPTKGKKNKKLQKNIKKNKETSPSLHLFTWSIGLKGPCLPPPSLKGYLGLYDRVKGRPYVKGPPIHFFCNKALR